MQNHVKCERSDGKWKGEFKMSNDRGGLKYFRIPINDLLWRI